MGLLNPVFDWLGLTNGSGANTAANTYTQSANDNTKALQALNNGQYYGAANNDYGQQQGAVGMLGAAANGQVPSAANLQMRSGQAAAAGNIQASALGNQGGIAPGLTQRNMLNAQANAQGQIVSQGAAMRAQEQAVARQQYAQALQAMRGQDQQQAAAQQSFDMGRLGMIQGNNQGIYGAQSGAAQQQPITGAIGAMAQAYKNTQTGQ